YSTSWTFLVPDSCQTGRPARVEASGFHAPSGSVSRPEYLLVSAPLGRLADQHSTGARPPGVPCGGGPSPSLRRAACPPPPPCSRCRARPGGGGAGPAPARGPARGAAPPPQPPPRTPPP